MLSKNTAQIEDVQTATPLVLLEDTDGKHSSLKKQAEISNDGVFVTLRDIATWDGKEVLNDTMFLSYEQVKKIAEAMEAMQLAEKIVGIDG